VQACELQLLSCKMPRRATAAPERLAVAPESPAPEAVSASEAPSETFEPERLLSKASRGKATKDPQFDESSLVSRFVGLLLVLGLAGGIIVCMLRS
jgi:hypothetical protein